MQKVLVTISMVLLLFTGMTGELVNANEPKTRKFTFHYGATIEGVAEGSKVRVWVPIAQSDESQNVEIVSKTFPAIVKKSADADFGNQMYYFEIEGQGGAGIAFDVTYTVDRRELRGLEEFAKPEIKLSEEARKLYLRANSKIPITGKAVELFEAFALRRNSDSRDMTQKAREFYDWVNDYMTYDKSKPGYGNGDVLWACDSKTGNCTDFHSLFISVARNRQLPAKFEIGFPLPEQRGEGSVSGYHCWAKFFIDQQGWIPVDISEADKHPELTEYYFGNLSENRMHFSTGRDIDLVPKQNSEPLNYFVYPHVEVDGQIWPNEKIKLSFGYKDK